MSPHQRSWPDSFPLWPAVACLVAVIATFATWRTAPRNAPQPQPHAEADESPATLIRRYALSPDGRMLAGIAHDHVVLWRLIGLDSRVRETSDRAEGRARILTTSATTLDWHNRLPRNVAWCPDGGSLVVGYVSGDMVLWNRKDGNIVPCLLGRQADTVHCCAFSPDGRLAASADQTGLVYLWDVGARRLLRSFQMHDNGVCSIEFSVDGGRLLSGGADGLLRLWDAAGGTVLREFQGHTDMVMSIAFSPDGDRAVSGGHDGTVRLWDIREGEELWCRQPDGFSVLVVAWSPDGANVACGGIGKDVLVYDVETRRLVGVFSEHRRAVHNVAFLPDGKTVFSSDFAGPARLWTIDANFPPLTARAATRSSSSIRGGTPSDQANPALNRETADPVSASRKKTINWLPVRRIGGSPYSHLSFPFRDDLTMMGEARPAAAARPAPT
jgi:WD40 repeat protein